VSNKNKTHFFFSEMSSAQVAYFADPLVRQQANPALHKLRRLTLRCGYEGFRALARAFKVKLSEANLKTRREVKLNQDDFKERLKSFGVIIDQNDLALLTTAFKDAVGYICVSTFLDVLSDCISQEQKPLVEDAFLRATAGQGGDHCAFENLRQAFRPRADPRVKSGAVSLEQCIGDFEDAFKVADAKDGRISKSEFAAYYSGVAFLLSSKEFEEMLTETWGLREPAPARRYAAPQPAAAEKASSQVAKSVAAPSAHSPERGHGATSPFSATHGKEIDNDNSHLISPPRRAHSPNEPEVTPLRIPGYTGHIPTAQERHGETFAKIEASVPRIRQRDGPAAPYVDEKNAFVRKGGKANAHNFKLA
jgi:Ca2+-binding EF-hand superfamily protein